MVSVGPAHALAAPAFRSDAGTRDFDFLKLTTDGGPIGWSEYNEGYGSAGSGSTDPIAVVPIVATTVPTPPRRSRTRPSATRSV